jgi:hypothetical protein
MQMGRAIADPPQPHALLNEVGQQQRQPDTEHNHDHRRHAAPRAKEPDVDLARID